MATKVIKELPLVVIAGPTASGKTALAIKLSKQFGGEIICADSRTVYRDMDIGTAKPTPEECKTVPHWGLDLIEPGERFTAADFKDYATIKVDEIRSRGNIPFLVGGTGLYLDSILFDFQFGPPVVPKERAALEQLSLEQLHGYCLKNNILLPENKYNKRYVIRAIEQKSISRKRRTEPIGKTIIVGIATDRQILRQRIYQRAEHLFDDGVVEEATLLGKKYGWECEAMTGNIYPLVHRYLKKELTENELKEKFTTSDWRLAKRQMTWLRRNPFINWFDLTGAEQHVSEKLAKL